MTDSPDAIRHFTATTDTAAAKVRLVAQDAVAQIDAGTFGCEAWGRSMLNFFNIMAQVSATHFQTAISNACCGVSSTGEAPCGMAPSDPVSVQVVDNKFPRELSVVAAFTRVGGQVSIPPNMIGFEPAVLPAGATSFAVFLRDVQYIGASYTGKVRLTRITSDAASVGFVDQMVTVEL